MDELLASARDLRTLLTQRAQTKVYELNDSDQCNVAAIHMTISLVELGILAKRPIAANDMHWFDGGTILTRQMDDSGGLGEEIFSLYLKLVAGAKKRGYFH